jgi:hypothetical protein
MALWGDRDDLFSTGTVSVKFAGINTYYEGGVLIEKSAGVAKTLADGTAATDLVYEVIGSIGAGAGTSFGKNNQLGVPAVGMASTNPAYTGFAQTGDILKFGQIIGGTYYGSGIIVGIASTTLCYIASTEGLQTGLTQSNLNGIEYTVNNQPTNNSGGLSPQYAQQNESDAETTNAGNISGLAFTASVSAASTTLFALDAPYTESFNADGNPRVRVGDTLSTYVSTGSWSSVTTLTAIGADKVIKVNTSALTQNAGVGVATVAINTGGINVGDTFQGNNICTAVATIGLATVGFAATIGYGLTSGNVIGFSRTVSNVVTGSASVISIAATDTELRVTRSTGANAVYLAGVSTNGTDSSQGTKYEITHGGWVGVTSYFDSDGNLRVKTETLVAMSGIITGNNPVLGPDPAVS